MLPSLGDVFDDAVRDSQEIRFLDPLGGDDSRADLFVNVHSEVGKADRVADVDALNLEVTRK